MPVRKVCPDRWHLPILFEYGRITLIKQRRKYWSIPFSHRGLPHSTPHSVHSVTMDIFDMIEEHKYKHLSVLLIYTETVKTAPK